MKLKRATFSATFHLACLAAMELKGLVLEDIKTNSCFSQATMSGHASELAELAKLVTATVVVPLGIFGANWFHRSDKGYSQTAASDFLLALLIFDAALAVTSKDFEPFVRSPDLRSLVMYWHVLAFVVSGGVWMSIVKWGEPVLETYYLHGRGRNQLSFPFLCFVSCWSAVVMLLAFHIGFFVANVGGAHG